MPAAVPAPLRRRALELVASGRTPREAAEAVGVTPHAVRLWMRAERAEQVGRYLSAAELAELNEMRRRVAQLELKLAKY